MVHVGTKREFCREAVEVYHRYAVAAEQAVGHGIVAQGVAVVAMESHAFAVVYGVVHRCGVDPHQLELHLAGQTANLVQVAAILVQLYLPLARLGVGLHIVQATVQQQHVGLERRVGRQFLQIAEHHARVAAVGTHRVVEVLHGLALVTLAVVVKLALHVLFQVGAVEDRNAVAYDEQPGPGRGERQESCHSQHQKKGKNRFSFHCPKYLKAQSVIVL